MSTVLLEARPFRPFKSGEEYLVAMKEDLAEWLQTMYQHLNITVDNFMEKLETGVTLCEHANAVKQQAFEYIEKKQSKKNMTKSVTGTLTQATTLVKIPEVKYFCTAKPQTFFARDNVCNFIHWCKNSLQIIECLLFESDDLIMRKNEKHVILCLLEVGRRAAKFGMLAPMLVQMERQIDREIAADQKKLGFNEGLQDHGGLEEDDSDMEDEEPVLMYGPVPQIVTNDLKSLDEMVRDLVAQCTCPTQFPMIRVSEGKYRIGDTKVLIFVRILRNHVMVRVGGGWDTLSHYLDKHDPCRCRSQHRTTQGARLVNRPGAADLHGSHVYYDRAAGHALVPGYASSNNSSSLGPPMNALNRSRSRSPSHLSDRRSLSPNVPRKSLAPPSRSRSPTPNFTSTHQTRLSSGKTKPSPTTSPVHQAKHANGKSHTQHIASMQIPIENRNLKSEASLQVNEDQSDTTSEVSDEGYRSLGAIHDKSKQRISLHSQDSVEDAEDNEHHIDGPDDTNDVGLRKTQYSRIYEDGPRTKPKETPKKESSPPVIREKSLDRNIPLPKSSPKKTDRFGTWNGRQKQPRPTLTLETFSPPLSRNGHARRSITPSPHERRHSSSASTSPTKGNLKQELINTVYQHDDETVIVEKVHKLLKEYGSWTRLDCEDGGGGKFARGGERMSFRSPRKDSRPDNHISRIPAPVL